MTKAKTLKITLEIQCPNCGNKQSYTPEDIKFPYRPHTNCLNCEKSIYIDVPKDMPKKAPKKMTGKFEHVNKKVLEQLILKKLNGHSVDLSLIKIVMDFCKNFKDEQHFDGKFDLKKLGDFLAET